MTLQDLENTAPWEWPRGAGRRILDELRQGPDRLAAADLAGSLTVMNDEMAEALLAIVRTADAPEELRARAAISLGPALEAGDMEETGGDWDQESATISEATFNRVREGFRQAYADQSAPKEVRRRILEASVRAPQEWHEDAVRSAYASGDGDWKLTAAFCMRYVPGFDKEILTLLESSDPEIKYEAILAAGEREIGGAWPKVRALLQPPSSDKRLLLAAIEAAPSIRADEARTLLLGLLDSEDEEVVEAADDAIAMAEGYSDDEPL